jgi:hypothetical protein
MEQAEHGTAREQGDVTDYPVTSPVRNGNCGCMEHGTRNKQNMEQRVSRETSPINR